MSRLFLFSALIAVAAPVQAQSPIANAAPDPAGSKDTAHLYLRKTLQAVRIAGTRPSIDGRLDESVWREFPAGTDFLQSKPNPGEPASQKTEVRFAYDDDAVYVGARMYDTSPDSMVAQLARRDNDVYSEWIFICLDSYFDKRTAFFFAVNPKGVKLDGLLYDDTNDDETWDAVWDVAARQDSLGWTAEFRIPLSQLRYSKREGETIWGANVMRRIARRNEESWWSAIRPDANAMVSAFGELHGIAGLKAPRRIEVLPYSMSRLVRAPGNANNPYFDSNDASVGAGADLKLGVTSDLTLTATINPDFGQVEADPSEVNLTAYETFFPEKRPFFIEGFDIFRAGIGVGDGDSSNEGLFYSRRIGRSPQGGVPDNAEFSDMPTAATILGAAKLSGKTRSGWSIGALSATTAREKAQFVDGSTVPGDVVVEPLTHYGVARVIKDLDKGQSAIGAIFTLTNRSLPNELSFLRANAYSGGLTGRKRWHNGDFQITSYLLASHVNGDNAAINRTQRSSARYYQRPDNDYVDYDPTRTSLTGASAGVELFKLGGGHLRYAAALNARTPGFEVNDLGFMPNSDQIFQAAYVGYEQFKPGKHFNRWNVNVNQWTMHTFGGERTSLAGNINGSLEFKNTSDMWLGLNRDQEVLSIAALRGGPAFLSPGRWGVHGGYDSDERKAFNYWISLNYNNEDQSDGQSIGVYPGLRVRASDKAELRFTPGVSVNRRAWQYVRTETLAGADRYLFGELDQVTTSLTTRLSYTFSPNLSLQLYAEPFVSAGDYTAFKEVTNPRGAHFDDRFHRFSGSEIQYDANANRYSIDRDGNGSADITLDNPDFNFRAFRSNVVLRWEYRPGSALFLVWSQGREGGSEIGDFRFRRDFDALFNTRASNVLLIKASYWLGL